MQAVGILAFLATSLAFASAAPATSTRYIVRLKEAARSSSGLKLVASELRSQAATRASEAPLSGFLIVDGDESALQDALKRNPNVAYYEEEKYWKISDAGSSSSIPSSQNQSPWLEDVLGLSETSPDPYVEASGDPVLVAVIDTGTRTDHPFLESALSINAEEADGNDGVDDDDNGYVDDVYGANAPGRDGDVTETVSSHGTHVAGIVKIVRDQAIHDYPKARDVQILPVRFIDESGMGSTSGAIMALEYAAERGARVINASWGAQGAESFSQALFETMATLYRQDIMISVAAGNAEGPTANNNDNNPCFPANFNIPGLISVASVTPTYSASSGRYLGTSLSSFSNYGANTVHVAAPGDHESDGGGSGILSANSGFGSWGGLYVRKQGTSMAAPIVSGIAGVIRAINPSLTAYETRRIIIDTVHEKSNLSRIKSRGIVHAADAFAAAKKTKSKGLRPPVSGRAYTGAPLADEDQRGGCGAIMPVKPQGPWGGNSMGLMLSAYAVWAFTRRLKRKSASDRV
jgi:subtilisin family serine protease